MRAAETSMTDSGLAHRVIMSFATIRFGVQYGQSKVIEQGYAMYGAALKQLNQALAQPGCHERDDVILSVAAMALLECDVPTGPDTYIQHVSGLEKLLRLRTPNLQADSSTSQLYGSLRHLLLLTSFRTATRSILTDPEWKSLFRADCSSSEDLKEQELWNILADGTILFEAWEKFLTKGDPSQKLQLDRYAEAQLARFRMWKERWEPESKAFYTGTPAVFRWKLEPPGHARDNDSRTYIRSFEFADDSFPRMLTLYNQAFVFVLRILASPAVA
jgi:hypothetical protein